MTTEYSITLVDLLKHHNNVLGLYKEWLQEQPDGANKVAKWSDDLRAMRDASKVEGAIAEALAWDYLRDRVDSIGSADDPSTGGPDFLCKTGGKSFYVEATNISSRVAQERTDPDPDCICKGTLTAQIKQEVQNKARQFRTGPKDQPLLLFISTLHEGGLGGHVERWKVSQLLTGVTKIGFPIHAHPGQSSGRPFEVSNFEHASATKNRGNEPARKHISGVIVAQFGRSHSVLGVCFTEAARPFDSNLLPTLPFAKLEPWPRKNGDVCRIVWSDGRDDD